MFAHTHTQKPPEQTEVTGKREFLLKKVCLNTPKVSVQSHALT